VERAVIASSEINSFFVFFETRCPLGEIHDWGSKDDDARSVFGGVFKQEDPSTITADNIYKLQEHLKAALKKAK
jgi:hypothetical protein